MYLFIVIFSMLSVIQDSKLQDLIKRHTTKSRKKLEKQENSLDAEIDEDLHNVKKVMGKRGVIHEFLKEIFSVKPRKSMFVVLKSY
ncbi:hypothetical protein IJU97_00200 [bacterium]|nr:hypothetical protein [bacterium]